MADVAAELAIAPISELCSAPPHSGQVRDRPFEFSAIDHLRIVSGIGLRRADRHGRLLSFLSIDQFNERTGSWANSRPPTDAVCHLGKRASPRERCKSVSAGLPACPLPF